VSRPRRSLNRSIAPESRPLAFASHTTELDLDISVSLPFPDVNRPAHRQ
jgi:hypothetical protein